MCVNDFLLEECPEGITPNQTMTAPVLLPLPPACPNISIVIEFWDGCSVREEGERWGQTGLGKEERAIARQTEGERVGTACYCFFQG
jgi:hypothetical protein